MLAPVIPSMQQLVEAIKQLNSMKGHRGYYARADNPLLAREAQAIGATPDDIVFISSDPDNPIRIVDRSRFVAEPYPHMRD